MKKIKLNTISSLILQIVTIVYGFVLPKLILSNYGSDVNGLITSLTQFLSVISLLEMGIGTVVQSALYKPLAEKNKKRINEIMTSAKKFFRIISFLLIIYVVIISIVYPLVVSKSNFSTGYIVSLIIILSLSTFVEYYFGLINGLLLIADQKGYIYYMLQIVTQVLCIIICPVLIWCDCSIQIVKLVTACITIIKPCMLAMYVRKNYSIDFSAQYDEEPIKQKWNGMFQHFAAIVLDNTDIVLLTVLSSLENVSIYSVYYLVLGGLRRSILMVLQSFQPYIGNLWVRDDKKRLEEQFQIFEWIVHMVLIFFFTCSAILVVPFVSVYTRCVDDADYYQPVFAILLTLAQAFRCLRTPYNMLIFVAGKYKETQNSYLIVCIINIVISLIMIWKFGLVGVAFGTMMAMLYHMFYMFWYSRNQLLYLSMKKEAKLCITDVGIICIAIVVYGLMPSWEIYNYIAWFQYSVMISVIMLLIIVVVNAFFNRKNLTFLFKNLRR